MSNQSDAPSRAMTEQEKTVARILRHHFHFVEGFAWEHPPVEIDKVACQIVRELITDAAFGILVGDDKRTYDASNAASIFRNYCTCPPDVQLLRCDAHGKRCMHCGLPA